jgi:hypothetical protein
MMGVAKVPVLTKVFTSDLVQRMAAWRWSAKRAGGRVVGVSRTDNPPYNPRKLWPLVKTMTFSTRLDPQNLVDVEKWLVVNGHDARSSQQRRR